MILTIAMALQRKLIRHAVVALLTNVTSAEDRVQGTRVEPNSPRKTPALSVYTLHDPVDQELSSGTAPRELTHDLQLEIAGWVEHKDSYPVDDAMDDLAEQIQEAMDGDRYLNGTAAESVLVETVMQVAEDNGRSDPLIGIVTLTYSVTYRESPATPASLDAFVTANVTQKLVGGVADTVPAIDTFQESQT